MYVMVLILRCMIDYVGYLEMVVVIEGYFLSVVLEVVN